MFEMDILYIVPFLKLNLKLMGNGYSLLYLSITIHILTIPQEKKKPKPKTPKKFEKKLKIKGTLDDLLKDSFAKKKK